ncbi:MAG: hypothetical protein KVP17_002550 [Porospora cf. gigantea B]|uniref:uncharacterized protein n=1 Tax=Porospora cf. gigantea B TaxID=2853592 RepID=UPI0035718903|nr:MAG: hypothetical protein KVP17_002550 [Porospora cf. gigantea B]
MCVSVVFANTGLRAQSAKFKEDTVAQDFGLQTDLRVQPTGVDVAMLRSLLNGAGPVLPLWLQTMVGRSLSEVDSLEGLQLEDRDVASEGVDNSRVAQDFGLQTDLRVQPTAVDVAMLQSLLKGAGPLLPLLLQTMFGRSLSEVDSLGLQLEDTDVISESLVPEFAMLQTAPFARPLLEVGDLMTALKDGAASMVYSTKALMAPVMCAFEDGAASMVSSTKALIAPVMCALEEGAASIVSSTKALIAPAMIDLSSGPIMASLHAIAKILSRHTFVAISALLDLIPMILGPPLKLILAGPALLSGFALLEALKCAACLATPLVICAAVLAVLVGPPIYKVLPGIFEQLKAVKLLLPMLKPILFSGPYGPLLMKMGRGLSHLAGPLSAIRNSPAVMSLRALIKSLISGTALKPLEKGIKALPVKLATAVAKAEGFSDTPNSSFSAFDLLNTFKN